MKSIALALIALCSTGCIGALAQAAPSATSGPANVRYAARYSQDAQFGGSLGDWQAVSPSGELAYSNGRSLHLFSLDYSGGYTHTLRGTPYAEGAFHRLAVSQGLELQNWQLAASDDVSYRPQAPTTGFSGIPGIGEPIGTPNPPTSASPSILTLHTHMLDNSVTGSVSHPLNFATRVTLDGAYDLLRFPDGNGTDGDTVTAAGGLQFRINARNLVQTQYHFSQFTYPSFNTTFTVDSGTVGIDRSWTRELSSRIFVGPALIASSGGTPAATSLQITGAANIDYHSRSNSASLMYSREASGGSGYLPGSKNDSLQGLLSRGTGRTLTFGVDAGYRRQSGLAGTAIVNSEYGGVQITRRLGRSISFFANYTAVNQSTSSPLGSNVLNALMQLTSVGVSYSKEIQPSR